MESTGNLSADDAARFAQRLPRFPKIVTEDQYGGQRGFMLSMVRKELLAKGFTDDEISGGGLRVTTTFTRRAMTAARTAVDQQRPKGLKGLHVAVASVDPQSGALRGMFAGQDYLKSQLNWAVAGGQPGSAFKPFALAAGLKDGYSLKSTFEGNSPYVFPNGRSKVVNEGPGDGNDYGSAISLQLATEQSVNTAYVDLTESMRERSAEDPRHGRRRWASPPTYPTSSRPPASRSARPRSARSTWPTPTARSPTAAGPSSGTSWTR